MTKIRTRFADVYKRQRVHSIQEWRKIFMKNML